MRKTSKFPNSGTAVKLEEEIILTWYVYRLRACFYIYLTDSISGLASAVLTILIRSAFRVAELQGGFHNKLANNEVALMILEGAMVSIACICLTGLHPTLLVSKNWKTPEAIGGEQIGLLRLTSVKNLR